MLHGEYFQPEARISEIIHEQGDIVSYTCDFGAHKFVGESKCDSGHWTKTPFCPKTELIDLFFDPK